MTAFMVRMTILLTGLTNESLAMRYNNRTKKAPGFTLVEILVTVAILAILGTVTVMMVSGVNKKAKISQANSQMTMIGSAIEAFKDATGKYPLAVPYDAWAADWDTATPDFIGIVGGDDWKEYFADEDTDDLPDFKWDTTPANVYPTNIQMLTFQLAQEPSANAILNRIKENTGGREQVKMDVTAMPEEKWQTATDLCELKHPLDDQLRKTFQLLDPWGTPYRYWNATTLKWAKEIASPKAAWPDSVIELLAEKLQAANWGFFLESAGPDRKFGWVGDSTSILDVQEAEDNIYSVK
jgi:prepilin-type N-terminal cleavage/methylation domain-containing protein